MDAILHYSDVMSAMASQITSLTIFYPTLYSGADQRKHQSSMSLAFVRGIHRRPVNSPHKGPVTRKMFSFDDVMFHLLCVNGGRELLNIPEFRLIWQCPASIIKTAEQHPLIPQDLSNAPRYPHKGNGILRIKNSISMNAQLIGGTLRRRS